MDNKNINKLVKKYEEVNALRDKVNNNSNLMEYYFKLKEKNKGDVMYGWMFEDDSVLCDTLEDLEDYNVNYIYNVLCSYENTLYNICKKEVADNGR